MDVDKPLGLVLGESTAAGGGLVVKSANGNAAKAGIQVSHAPTGAATLPWVTHFPAGSHLLTI